MPGVALLRRPSSRIDGRARERLSGAQAGSNAAPFESSPLCGALEVLMTAPKARESAVTGVISGWLDHYQEAHRDEVAGDEEFARWLEEEYVPLAGGWHY